ncbi:CLUMA_CG004534, isoform A [Clunio marinus]|uniref:1-acyl-sn-glycerol-3-phosphate acyltransferase n=1 Tax=Clunio marinus TaxID=568069 RepID=A0A1J1HTZ7_9DIPT|nr:CLUMA_CG004534, isoform A [Clunio marinus]
MDSSWEFVMSAMLSIYLIKNYKPLIYYLKFNYFCGSLTTIVTILIPYFMLKPRNVLNFLVCCAGCKHISKVIGIKWTLRGAENLSKDRTCVFVANHQSSLDIQGMIDVWPVIKKMTAIAKRELLFAGPFGISMFLAGLTFINRQAGEKAGQEMINMMEDLKKKNIKLWVFPEGTRRNTGEIHQFKKGAFYTAIQAQVPIVPVVFSSYKPFLDSEKKIFNKGEVIITALPEVSTKNLTVNDVDDLIKQVRDSMISVYVKTSKEITTKMLKFKED